MRHKPPVPTEAYTVSCHCTSSHSKHQNEILSLSTSVALGGCILSCLPVSIYFIYISIYMCVFILICLLILSSVSPPHFLRELWCNERHARGCFPLPSSSLFLLCFPLYTQYTYVYIFLCGRFSPVTPASHPTSGGCQRNLSGVGEEMFLTMITNNPRGPERSTVSEEQQ